MMSSRVCLPCLLIASCLFLALLSTPSASRAQAITPPPAITPQWENTQNFCPPDTRCGQMWRMSGDGQHLFLFVVPSSTMYVFSPGTDNVVSYFVSQFPLAKNLFFDYFPVDDHTVLFLDQETGGKLRRLDLQTGATTIFGVDGGLRSCMGDSLSVDPPFNSFHYLPTSHSLLVCRVALDGSNDPIISTVDLNSAVVTDIVRLPDSNYVNVVGGRDGSIYIQPGLGPYWSFIPQYIERLDSITFVLRWNPATSGWDTIEIPSPSLRAGGANIHNSRFFGVDIQSNLYFQDVSLTPNITKVNPTGAIEQVFENRALGSYPYVVGLDSTGQLIVMNRVFPPDANTTAGVEVSNYVFATPISTPTATPK